MRVPLTVSKTWLFGVPLALAAGFGAGFSTAPMQSTVSPVAAVGPAKAEQEAATALPVVMDASAAGLSQPASTPDAVFAALLAPTDLEQADRMKHALATLDSEQLRDVVARAMRISRQEQGRLLPLAIDRWLEADPPAAAQWIETNAATFRQGSETFRSVLRVFAHRNVPLGEEVLARLPAGDRADALTGWIVESLTRSDPKAALARWKALPNGKSRNSAEWNYRYVQALEQPTEALDELLLRKSVTSGEWREMIFREAVQSLARGGLGAAEQALDRITVPKERAKAFDDLLATVSGSDFARLADFYDRAIKSDPAAAAAFQGTAQIARGMASNAGPKALAWVESLPAENQAEARAAAAREWGWQQPVAALAWVNEKVTDETREGLTREIFTTWIGRRPADAQAWVGKLPPGPLRQQSVESAASALAAAGEFDAALQWLGELPPDSQSKIATDAAAQLTWSNPAAAARWAANIEADENSAPLFGQIAQRWATVDFKAAATWINQLPAGIPRDSAVIRYASAVAKVDPAGAAEWAVTTSDERSRTKLVSAVAAEWLHRDRSAAEKWLKTAPLSAEQIGALLAKP